MIASLSSDQKRGQLCRSTSRLSAESAVKQRILQSMLCVQSKASCMSAHALQPQLGWTVLDACAAPGNKTTHVAGKPLATLP